MAVDKFRNENAQVVMRKIPLRESFLPSLFVCLSVAIVISILLRTDFFYQLCVKTGYLGIEWFRVGMKKGGAEIPDAIFTLKQFNGFHLGNFLALAIFGAISLLYLKFPSLLRFRFVFLVVCFVQLAYFGLNFNPTISEKFIYIPTRTTQFLKENSVGYRIAKYKTNNILPSGPTALLGFDEATKKVCSISSRHIFRLFAALDPSSTTNIITGIVPFSEIGVLRKPILNAMAIKYIVTSEPIPEIDRLRVAGTSGSERITVRDTDRVAGGERDLLEKFILVWQDENSYIYENRDVLPRAFLSFGAKTAIASNGTGEVLFGKSDIPVAIESSEIAHLKIVTSDDFQPDRIVLLEDAQPILNTDMRPALPVSYKEVSNQRYEYFTESDKESYLYVADCFDPGWSALVDGSPAKIQKANYAFRAVYLPPGKHTVVMTYVPPGYSTGKGLSLIALMFVAVYGLWLLLRSKSRKRALGPMRK